jgi:hypothetical protein
MVCHWLIDSNSSAPSSQHPQTLRFFPREVKNIKHDRYFPQGLERSNPHVNYPHTRETCWASCHARRLAQKVALVCGELYRPISLLPIIAKVLERFVWKQLYGHVITYISLSQHGFLRNRSCITRMLQVLRHNLFRFRKSLWLCWLCWPWYNQNSSNMVSVDAFLNGSKTT